MKTAFTNHPRTWFQVGHLSAANVGANAPFGLDPEVDETLMFPEMTFRMLNRCGKFCVWSKFYWVMCLEQEATPLVNVYIAMENHHFHSY